jgi:hypothetical protein
MNKNKSLHKINLLITELKETINEDSIQNLSQLEIDLSLDKLKRMYEIILDLKSESSLVNENQDTEVKVKEATSEVKKIPLKIDEEIYSAETDKEDEEIDNEEIIPKEKDNLSLEFPMDEPIDKMVSEPVETMQELEDKELDIKAAAEIKDTPEEVKAGDVLDLFDGSIKESSNKKETVADKLLKKSLVSIKSAIGINEKFFFLNELFGGDLQVYNDHIEMLDSLETLEDTKKFFNEIQNKFNWDSESEAYQQLLQMIENKFN